MLLKIMSEGPTTVGIFRRSPNARAMRELRERLDNAEDVDFAECSVFVAAALLKVCNVCTSSDTTWVCN